MPDQAARAHGWHPVLRAMQGSAACDGPDTEVLLAGQLPLARAAAAADGTAESAYARAHAVLHPQKLACDSQDSRAREELAGGDT